MALSSFKSLRYIASIFQTISKTAGLCLKPPKCVVIPTSEPCTDELVNYIKTWLASNIPEWSNFSIKPVGKYLGFQLGPQAGSCQWDKAISDFVQSSSGIANAHAAVSITSALHNTRAVSVLLYIAQLIPLPAKFGFTERKAMTALLHLCTNSFTYNSFYSLPLAGGPKLYCATAAALASRFRMAWNTRHLWQEWKRQLSPLPKKPFRSEINLY